MCVLNGLVFAFIFLLIGDFLSTFFYHIPEHVFGKFPSLVHHSPNRRFQHYAVLSRNSLVIIDGLLGALPYLVLIPWLWGISPLGVILGELHIIWRHMSSLDYKTPLFIATVCKVFCITTPERHWLHHQDARLAYGDIFIFFEFPAQVWFKFLLFLKQKFQQFYIKIINSPCPSNTH